MIEERHVEPDPPCPHGPHEPAAEVVASVRQGKADMADIQPHYELERGWTVGVIDVGWRCKGCGFEWGFELLTAAGS